MRMHGYVLSRLDVNIEDPNADIFKQDLVRLWRHLHHVLRCGDWRKHNREKHSHKHEMQIFHELSIPVIRTADAGVARFQTDNTHWDEIVAGYSAGVSCEAGNRRRCATC